MAENKLTDEEIKKVLECCSNPKTDCEDCPCYGTDNCISTTPYVLDLINRYEAKIEKLQKLLDDKCDRCIARDKAEAIKEFAERLKDYGTLPDLPWDIWKTFADAIDNLVKEMVGAENGKENQQ